MQPSGNPRATGRSSLRRLRGLAAHGLEMHTRSTALPESLYSRLASAIDGDGTSRALVWAYGLSSSLLTTIPHNAPSALHMMIWSLSGACAATQYRYLQRLFRLSSPRSRITWWIQSRAP